MGKGFNNFMSKKDFHPAAFWNIKKVWEVEQKAAEVKKKQEDLRVQYEKEQEILNNRALLGDEKAKVGLSFMYDAPAGLREQTGSDVKAEPKFEWQRKYNAPRESWAKGDENVQDQPFGIAVRNVRCVKCHTWGHLNTDRECPLYNMSGNHESAGYSTNPSDLIKHLRKEQGVVDSKGREVHPSVTKDRMESGFLNSEMQSEYGLTFKKHVIDTIQSDEVLQKMGKPGPSKTAEASAESPRSEQQLMFEFLKTLSDKEKAKILKKFFHQEEQGKHKKKEKGSKKEKSLKSKAHRKRSRKHRETSSSGSSSDSEASADRRSSGKSYKYKREEKVRNDKYAVKRHSEIERKPGHKSRGDHDTNVRTHRDRDGHAEVRRDRHGTGRHERDRSRSPVRGRR